MEFRLPPVYPITDKLLARKSSHADIVRELIRGGAQLVQVRDKSTPWRDLLPDLRRCSDYCLEANAVLIVNDRCDLGLAAGAHGVHLGQDDLPPQAARLILGPERIIGYSTHNLEQVRTANGLPIDYAGFGPVFPTSTKERPSPVTGLEELNMACLLSTHPVVAIGGIGLGSVRHVLQAGAASAAVISGLIGEADIARSMERFLKEARERG